MKEANYYMILHICCSTLIYLINILKIMKSKYMKVVGI